jgi:hypothetical protein
VSLCALLGLQCTASVLNSGWSDNSAQNDIALCFLETPSRFAPVTLADQGTRCQLACSCPYAESAQTFPSMHGHAHCLWPVRLYELLNAAAPK